METKPLLGWDTETHLIDQTSQLPKLVCLSKAFLEPQEDGNLVASDTPEVLRLAATEIVNDRDCIKIGQNTAFDLGVFSSNYPDLLPAIFIALDDGQFSCTMIREKLLNLADTGDLAFLSLPDGSKSPIKYGLESLVKKYFGIDLSAEKAGTDQYRTNYKELDGVPLDRWPEGAKTYPIDDAKWPIKIYKKQEERRAEMIQRKGIDPLATEHFRLMVDFCLKLMSAHGVATDPVAVAKVEEMLAKELAPGKLNLLVEKGILRPASPPRPFANGARDHAAECQDKKNCQCPVKMAAGTKESVNETALGQHVLEWAKITNTDTCPTCNGQGSVPAKSVPNVNIGCTGCGASGRVPKAGDPKIVLKYTDPSDKFPAGQLSITSDFLAAHAHLLDDVLKQYQHREKLQKLVTTEIPRMKLNGVLQSRVYPQYDVLKETGRTSSFASKPTKDKPQTCAQFNCQNVDPRVRGCYVTEEDKLMWSADYSQMELGTLAQKCYELFGYSVLRDKINAKVDVHAYTGAQLAFAMDPEFQKDAIAHFGNPSPEQIHNLFLEEKDEKHTQFKHYKHWRKFAKPVNLGYPGGLGPATFVTYAASEQYGVHVTEEEATILRDLWKQTYPEMVDYFKHINKACIDPFNKGWDEKEKQEYNKYCYQSPYGLYRAGCDYCAAANGLGLQTPSADGALTSIIKLVQACFVPGVNDILGPVNGKRVVTPIMFIHDEFVGEIADDGYAHDRCMEIKRIMIESMAMVTPDVTPNANICLMRRWDKAAEPVFDSAGRLNVWVPKP